MSADQLPLFSASAPVAKPKRPATAARVRESATWTPAVSELPAAEQPVNRLAQLGARSLSTTELLAVVLGGAYQLQDASALLAAYGSLSALARSALAELQQQPGVGPKTAARLQAAAELGRRMVQEHRDDLPQIRCPADAANLVMADLMFEEQEHMVVLLLDTKNRVLATRTVYVGSVNTAVIRVGEMFREAVRANCTAVIVVHNHPSGDPAPSPEDVAVTRQIVEAGKLLDIQVLDHLVIGRGRFVSLQERGLGF